MCRPDAPEFADLLGLSYVADDIPGITRRRRGKGWSFHDPDGTLLTDSDRERCLALAVPPAWTEVWISADPFGHVQARGIDAADRRQYRYHDRWTEGRRLANFDRLSSMGRRIGDLRRELQSILEEERDERTRATAAMVRLVDVAMARIGGQRSAERFGHFGVSTLLPEHVQVVDDETLVLDYVGKAGKPRYVEVADPSLAEVVAQLELQGDSLFAIRERGQLYEVSASDANEMLAGLTHGWMTCKDFRTWGGSAVALEARIEGASPVEAVDAAAAALGNTRAVARSSYVHPDLLEDDTSTLHEAWGRTRSSSRFERRERALDVLLSEAAPLLDRFLTEGRTPAAA